MIELWGTKLRFAFPDVHPRAKMFVSFHRTLRIPDDGKEYPLPPGLDTFPLRHVDDYINRVPESWKEHGGVMLPMYQSEALWIDFYSFGFNGEKYPFAVKVATGKIDAVSGKEWQKGLTKTPQNYIVVPDQPWLDGYCVGDGVIRQFVAMPLGRGYTTEEQLTGKPEYGGIQIQVFPMKREIFEKRFPVKPRFWEAAQFNYYDYYEKVCMSISSLDMGLAPGGRMKQEIYKDPYDMNDWDLENTSRCFVHIANSEVWKDITGEYPPTMPPTAKDYSDAGLPWFEYYADNPDIKPLKGSKELASLKSVTEKGEIKGESPLPENDSVDSMNVIHIKGKTDDIVREYDL
jgi:hypothetical protein